MSDETASPWGGGALGLAALGIVPMYAYMLSKSKKKGTVNEMTSTSDTLALAHVIARLGRDLEAREKDLVEARRLNTAMAEPSEQRIAKLEEQLRAYQDHQTRWYAISQNFCDAVACKGKERTAKLAAAVRYHADFMAGHRK